MSTPEIQLAKPLSAFSTPACQSADFEPVANVPIIDFSP